MIFQILITSDTVVVFGCTMIWGIPNSELWEWYELFAYPILGPILMPITQISMMISVYCTTLMSFERYTRIGKRCQMKDCSFITDDNLKYVLKQIFFLIMRFSDFYRNIAVKIHQINFLIILPSGTTWYFSFFFQSFSTYLDSLKARLFTTVMICW